MIERRLAGVISLSLGIGGQCAASTTVCGEQSGDWTLAGSPYLVECTVTVASDALLSIEPGVSVLFFDGVGMDVAGQVVAKGTSAQPIVFDAVTDQFLWRGIRIEGNGPNPPTSEFEHSVFRRAQTALDVYLGGKIINDVTTMDFIVRHGEFDDTVDAAIVAKAQGVDASQSMTPRRLSARLNLSIDANRFSSRESALTITAHGQCIIRCASGTADSMIVNNLFIGANTAAVSFVQDPVDPSLSSGASVFTNNTVVGNGTGLTFPERFEVDVTNNLFYDNETALVKVANATVGHNLFFANTTHCDGCAPAFGSDVLVNDNGDPVDLASNVFLEPRFLTLQGFEYHLGSGSPAIDAGTAATAPATDFDGDPRPVGARPDIGFDEAAGTLPIFSDEFERGGG